MPAPTSHRKECTSHHKECIATRLSAVGIDDVLAIPSNSPVRRQAHTGVRPVVSVRTAKVRNAGDI